MEAEKRDPGNEVVILPVANDLAVDGSVCGTASQARFLRRGRQPEVSCFPF